MYGDGNSYFIIRELFARRRIDLGEAWSTTCFSKLEHYGAMLNGTHFTYLTQFKAPFLRSSCGCFTQAHDTKDGPPERKWFSGAYADLEKERLTACGPRDPPPGGANWAVATIDLGEGSSADERCRRIRLIPRKGVRDIFLITARPKRFTSWRQAGGKAGSGGRARTF